MPRPLFAAEQAREMRRAALIETSLPNGLQPRAAHLGRKPGRRRVGARHCPGLQGAYLDALSSFARFSIEALTPSGRPS